jgi:hypothetical protein
MLGPRLLVSRPTGDLVRFDIDPNGKLTNATKLHVAPSSDMGPQLGACRAGAHDVILLPGHVVFDTPKGFVDHARQHAHCSASGVVWSYLHGCTPDGCADHPEAIFRSESGLHDLPTTLGAVVRDRVGKLETIAWVARLGGGLLVRGNAADIATTVVIANGEEIADVGEPSAVDLMNGGGLGRFLGVYGGPGGGVVLYRSGRGPQLGVAVGAAGEVSPLSIEGL